MLGDPAGKVAAMSPVEPERAFKLAPIAAAVRLHFLDLFHEVLPIAKVFPNQPTMGMQPPGRCEHR